MKLSFAGFVIAACLQEGLAFTPSRSAPSSRLALSSTPVADTPERVAPGAGYVPDWEDREGLPVDQFLQSDESKPDLSGMWECPLTKWDSEG